MVTQQSSDKPAMSARDVMRAGGVDPDAPFEVGPFPPEMRMRPPQQSSDMVERVARAMQRENRPNNDCRNRDQREADEDASLDGYVDLANAALEASHHAELVEAVRLALDFIEGAEESIREKLSLGGILRAVLAKIGGDQ